MTINFGVYFTDHLGKTKKINVSSLHFNFLPQPNNIKQQNPELLVRQGIQFHWKNNNYKSFDDFLKTLSSRKRKVIKKERLCIDSNNLKIKLLADMNLRCHHK